MASNGNAKHKNLASAFGSAAAGAPGRGSKLQGLLDTPRTTAPTQPPQSTPAAPEPNPPVDASKNTPAEPAEVLQLASTGVGEASVDEDAGGGGGTRAVVKQRQKRTATAGKGGSASSVYLTAEAYKQLTTTKRLKIKDYAQIVQDAFAQIANEAADQQKSPDEVLASLFKVPESAGAWMMPSSTTRAKSSTPLTEARISFSPQQREWIEERMAAAGVDAFSEFIARVLEHHLLPAKPKRGKKSVSKSEG